MNIKVRWWSDSKRASVVETHGKVIAEIRQTLAESAIDLPFPTRVVLFHDQTEEVDGDRARQREGWPAGSNSPRPRHLNEIKADSSGMEHGRSR